MNRRIKLSITAGSTAAAAVVALAAGTSIFDTAAVGRVTSAGRATAAQGHTKLSNDTTTTATSPTVLATTTTSMPPRAQPVRLAPTSTGLLSGFVIVVDPGHNGRNYLYTDVKRAGSLNGDGPSCNSAGASTNAGLEEMEINWKVGTRLSDLLRALGAEVVMTHPDLLGFGPCADERGIIATQVNAAAFVSIHADGSESGSGFHIIYPGPKDTLNPLGVAASKTFAGIVRDQLVVIGGRPANYVGTNGTQERTDLANLNTANRPAVLAEMGNLRSGIDASMLSDPASYEPIARALARSVLALLGRAPNVLMVSPDINGDGQIDYLIGAPQLTATTTTVTPTSIAPPAPSTTELPSKPTSPTTSSAVSDTTTVR